MVIEEIKQAVVDEMLEHFCITGTHSGGEQALVDGVRRMLDDAANDDIEFWIVKPNCEFCARLSLTITKHEKACTACKGWPMRTVCQRCKDTGLEPEVRDE